MRIPPGSLFKIGEVDSQPLQYFCWLLKLEVEKSIDITLPGLGCCAAIQIHLRKALELQKDAPVLFNNLAVALSMQGKHDEASAIAEQIPTRFPDYFFGQVIAVRKAIQANDLDTAKTILDKMMEKRELHATEFGALCACQIDYMIESDKPEGAIS